MEVLDINTWKSSGVQFQYPALILDNCTDLMFSALCTYLNGFKDNYSEIKINVYIRMNNKYKQVSKMDFTMDNLAKILKVFDKLIIAKSKDEEFEVENIADSAEKLKEVQ